MLDCGSEPYRVCLTVEGEAHPAEALELSGQRASLRCPGSPHLDDDVRLELDWGGGVTTTLPAVVRSVAPAGAAQHLVHVEVTGVEGAWDRFLAYLGPTFSV